VYRTELSVLKGCGSLNQKIVRPSQSIGVPFPHFETCSVFEGMYRNANSSLKSMLMIPALFGKVLPWRGMARGLSPPCVLLQSRGTSCWASSIVVMTSRITISIAGSPLGFPPYTAGVTGSIPVAPTIFLSKLAILVEHCLFWFFRVLKTC